MAESTESDPATSAVKNSTQIESEHEDEEDTTTTGPQASSTAAKKKKSKKKKIKAALTGGSSESGPSKDDLSKAVNSLSNEQLAQLLALNPALAQQIGATPGDDLQGSKALEMLKKLSLEDIMTGLAASGKNVKDMSSYKFWQTQPVPKLGEKSENIVEGPFKIINPEKVSKEPGPLIDGFEWVTMDITNDEEIKEVFELLTHHYVEDDAAKFRFNYSAAFFRWALMCPGWNPDWNVGVRATASRKLVAFISAVPVKLRVRQKVLTASEVNFLCVHKKLRSKRLTPVLIKEITRRCYQVGTWQAIYTAGIVLPTPVSTCRYYHRALDWEKLYEVGFSPLPPNSKPSYQVRKYLLPQKTVIPGLRPMESKDLDTVLDLLQRYLAKFEMAPVLRNDELAHLLELNRPQGTEQTVWTYVVEEPSTKKVTDMFSFYCLESSVIGHPRHEIVRAAYLFYYASETSLKPKVAASEVKTRLNALMNDALILAKRYKFDVFNALTLMDNNLFLEQQKFGAGDGQLHYYLYNYNANPISGGVDKKNKIVDSCSGIGVLLF